MSDDRGQRSPRYYGFLPSEPTQSSRRYFAGIPVTFILVGWAVVAIIGVSVGILIGKGIVASNPGTTHIGDPTAAPALALTPLPTQTPTPKGPHLISGAFIGGTEDAFAHKYGQPTIYYGIPKFAVTTSDGASALIGLYDLMAGTDGQQRVVLMTVEPSNDVGATQTGIQRLLKLVMPSDAKHVRDLITTPVRRLEYSSRGHKWPAYGERP